MSMRTSEEIQEKVNDVLKITGLSLPVNLDAICDSFSINTVFSDLGADISGILVIDSSNVTIGINRNDNKFRRRFTRAHELGHFLMHRNGVQKESLFVDKKITIFNRKKLDKYVRDNKAKPNKEEELVIQEYEANTFAARLLMPKRLVKQAIISMGLADVLQSPSNEKGEMNQDEVISSVDCTDEKVIGMLAEKFGVSSPLMSYRLCQIDFDTYSSDEV